MLARVLALSAALVLAGCAAWNTQPNSPPFSRSDGPDRLSIFADRHGGIYPPHVEPAAVKSASLRRTFDAETYNRDQAAVLDLIAEYASAKSRIFIFTHGFNDPPWKSAPSFKLLRQTIVLGANDGVIELHWDGLESDAPQKIWFDATGRSQIVGQYALRPILNRIHGKPIYLVAHSRGTSVVLSALSDPSYDQQRLDEERDELGEPLPAPERFLGNGNRIHAIFLAPAIGCPDFWKPTDARTEPPAPPLGDGFNGDRLRAFPKELETIQYTVNEDDWVLRKKIRLSILSASFNATNLGWDPRVGPQLERTYPIMSGLKIHGIGHAFADYVDHPAFKAMMKRVGVEVTPPDGNDLREFTTVRDVRKAPLSARICTTHWGRR